MSSKTSWRGCLRDIYYNHVPLLEPEAFTGTHHGKVMIYGGSLEQGCQDISHAIIGFPIKGTLIRLERQNNKKKDNGNSVTDDKSYVEQTEEITEEVSFHFRSVKPSCVLFYVGIHTTEHHGHIQVGSARFRHVKRNGQLWSLNLFVKGNTIVLLNILNLYRCHCT